MRLRGAALAGVCFLLAAAPASAEPSQSRNVEAVAHLSEPTLAIAINFIGKTMFVSTTEGLFSYDVTKPAEPQLLDVLVLPIWENEDMDVDPVRKRVILSRDPRGIVGPVTPGGTNFPYGAFHIVDAADPSDLKLEATHVLEAGHTSTCINKCDFLWTAGPSRGLHNPEDWGGRPIIATDIRDPQNPKECPHLIDMERNDGTTDYVHDVQVDRNGVAWVSGRGGVRAYVTSGVHRDPLTGKRRRASACDPIPYAGGGTPESVTKSRFMHNSWHNPRATIGRRRGDVLYATEENVTSDCASAGVFVTYDLRGSYRGQGFKDIARTKFRMKALDSWTPENQPGSDGCASAHYFADRGDGVIAQAFYEQGVRFLDVSKPRNIRQIGWYRPGDGQAWAAYWHDGYVYVADFMRGVDVLRFKGGKASAAARAPVLASAAAAQRRPSPLWGALCPLRSRS